MLAYPLHNKYWIMDRSKKILIFLFLSLLISFIEHSSKATTEPTLRQLEMAALKYASLDPQEIIRWKSKAKWAKALPQLMVGYQQRIVNQINNTIQDSISVTGSNVTIGPPQSQSDQNDNFNQGFEIRATWALDEVVFNKDSLSISSEARYRTLMRSQVLDELHQTYFERKKILLREEGKKREELTPILQLQLEALEAKLDSLTGGYFSQTAQLKEIKNENE